MSNRVALIKHDRPRILALDFAESETNKIKSLGYNIRSGKTGSDHSKQYNIPWALQDVEILIANVSQGSFSQIHTRNRHANSIEEGPNFKALLLEVWLKEGWTILFIQQDTSPADLDALGISNIGVVSIGGILVSHNDYLENKKYWTTEDVKVSPPHLPRFKGEAVVVDTEEPENEILQRHLHAAKMSILSVDRSPRYESTYYRSRSLIWDESSDRAWLALRIEYGQKGKILLLPDFGKNNIDVAIALLQEVIPDVSPSLFDEPQHKWLTDYLPHPVLVAKKEKEEFLSEAQEKYRSLQQAEDELLNNFDWLLGLLTSPGDEFRDKVAFAFDFIGFRVEVIDLVVAAGEPLKEDLHIIDADTGFFAIGETKSTRRGASESFLTDIQNHQGRYSREQKVPVPNAILVVNHSTQMDPSIRVGRFYQNRDIEERCKTQGILAIDSVALFSMCQAILSDAITKDTIRTLLQNRFGVIRSFELDSTNATS